MIEVLVKELMNARRTKDQDEINNAAKNLADYLWKDNLDISYQDLLEGFGYIKGGKVYGIFKQR